MENGAILCNSGTNRDCDSGMGKLSTHNKNNGTLLFPMYLIIQE